MRLGEPRTSDTLCRMGRLGAESLSRARVRDEENKKKKGARMTDKKIRNIEDVAEYLGASRPTNESISHRVYKDTNCGAWAKVLRRSGRIPELAVGSIIEGADVDAPTIWIPLPCSGDDIDRAIEETEASVDHYLAHGTFF